MSQPQVSIIGAGISGLVLGRCLLQRGVSCVLYDKSSTDTRDTRHGYGITLHPSTYRPMLKYLGMDESSFRKKVAVDAAAGGIGRVVDDCENADVSSFRVNRRTFESMLREGLKVNWGHGFGEADVENGLSNISTTLFGGSKKLQPALVVGADGVHSLIRKSISPTTEIRTLPFAVYYGRRQMTIESFEKRYASYMNGTNVIEYREGQTLMQIAVDDRTKDSVSISYTYSRPAKEGDPAFHPHRRPSQATDFRDALFDDVVRLRDLDVPFKEVFNVDKMRNDRLLNWLMRSLLVEHADLRSAADHGVVMLGDSVHAAPILGGHGANAAIRDAIELADWIVERGTNDLAKFYESRYETWRKYVESSEVELAKMHGISKANL